VNTLRQILTIVGKDLRGELRTKEALTGTVFFSLLVLLVFNFAFEPGSRDMTVVGAGILWIAFLFASILAMNRLMLNEREDGGIEGLMLCPTARSSLYVAKCTSLLLLLLTSEALTLLLFVILLRRRDRRTCGAAGRGRAPGHDRPPRPRHDVLGHGRQDANP